MNKKVYQIAIDGPGGSGKSSVATTVANKLNFLFINTGGMYRCFAIALKNIDLSNIDLIVETLNKNIVTLKEDKLFLNNIDVTNECYTPGIAMLASKIGTIKKVRKHCVKSQQQIASGENCVMEGRDTTTVVLPNATLKIYLTASLQERAKRRWLQNNMKDSFENVMEDLKKRDNQDMNRKVDPLRRADDAIELNTDHLSFNQVVTKIIELFNNKVKEIE